MEDTCAECVPPSVVFCLARGPEEAAVWWLIRADGKTVEEGVPARPADPVDVDLDALRGVTAWQLLRYRRDRSPPFEWRCKGMLPVGHARTLRSIILCGT